VCLQLEDVHSEGDSFFELPNATKSCYGYSTDNHGWTAMEQERSANISAYRVTVKVGPNKIGHVRLSVCPPVCNVM